MESIGDQHLLQSEAEITRAVAGSKSKLYDAVAILHDGCKGVNKDLPLFLTRSVFSELISLAHR